jgi:hypothetical protein
MNGVVNLGIYLALFGGMIVAPLPPLRQPGEARQPALPPLPLRVLRLSLERGPEQG